MMRHVCRLEYAEELRRSNDRYDPQWAVDSIWCPLHQEYHEFSRDIPQVPMAIGASERPSPLPGKTRQKKFSLLPDGRACFHDNSSPAVSGPCPHCGTILHVHQDMLGPLKSGRHGTGYLEERCPACHRWSAVHAAYGLGGIRTSKLAEGGPAMQMKLRM